MKLYKITPWALMLTSLAWASIGVAAPFSAPSSEMGTVTDNDDDGYDTISTANMHVRRFDGTIQERGVATFDVAAIEDVTVLNASITLDITSTANPGAIAIVLFNGDALVDLGDATAVGVESGSFDPQALGVGTHTVELNATAIEALLLSGSPLTARLQGADNGVNTFLNGAILNVDFEPATTYGSLDDATLTDVNGDGIFDLVINDTNNNDVYKGSVLGTESRTIMSFDAGTVDTDFLIGASLDLSLISFDNNTQDISIVGFAGDGALGTGDATRAAVVLGQFSPSDLGLGRQSIGLDLDAMRTLLDGHSQLELRLDPTGVITNAGIGANEGGVGAELMLDIFDGTIPTQAVTAFSLFRSTFVNWSWDSSVDSIDLYLDGLFFETVAGSGNKRMRISREPHSFKVCVTGIDVCSPLKEI